MLNSQFFRKLFIFYTNINIRAIINIFYVIIKFLLTILSYQYEPSKKNKLLNAGMGAFIGIINSALIFALFLSILFQSIEINSEIMKKLKKEMRKIVDNY